MSDRPTYCPLKDAHYIFILDSHLEAANIRCAIRMQIRIAIRIIPKIMDCSLGRDTNIFFKSGSGLILNRNRNPDPGRIPDHPQNVMDCFLARDEISCKSRTDE